MNNSDRLQPKNNLAESSQLVPSRIVEVKWSCRWEVFRRLQALDIKCSCSTNKPLMVYLHSPTTIIQIWSVLRQCGASRRNLIDWLDNCWETESQGGYFSDKSQSKNIR